MKFKLKVLIAMPIWRLAIGAAACALHVGAMAQAGRSAAGAPQAVVITATRTPQKVSDLVADVTVLDREALQRSEGRTLTEVLAQVPGLQFTSTGGLGKTASLFVRGLESRHLLLLVDGVRVGSATVNAPSLDNLPLDAVERIEIVRGPMTAVYGSNAMGGVVQVFTRRGHSQGLRPNVKLGAGSDNYGLISAGATFGAPGVDLAVQAQHLRTDGFSSTNATVPFGSYNADNDGFKQNAGSVRAGWSFAPGWRLEGLLLQSDGKTQIDDGPGADARAGLHNSVQSLQLGGPVWANWRTQLALGRSVDRYDTLSSASAFASLGVIETDQQQVAWENRIGLPLGEALVVLERVRQDVARPGTPFDVSSRHTDALATGWSAALGAHNLQASLRHDRNSQFGGQTTGALAYAWAFAPQWRAGGSAGTSFTAPSFNQLYFPGFGSPTLVPEEGRHGELFVQWSAGDQRVRGTVYQHRYELFISSGPLPTNIPKVDIDGLTLAWDGRVAGVDVSASYDRVDARNASVGNSNFGKRLQRRAQQSAKLGADWQVGAFKLGASAQAYGHRFDDAANQTRLAGYALLDLRAEWAVARDWALGLRLNNVGAKVYETALGYNQPGREGFVTLRWAMR